MSDMKITLEKTFGAGAITPSSFGIAGDPPNAPNGDRYALIACLLILTIPFFVRTYSTSKSINPSSISRAIMSKVYPSAQSIHQPSSSISPAIISPHHPSAQSIPAHTSYPPYFHTLAKRSNEPTARF